MRSRTRSCTSQRGTKHFAFTPAEIGVALVSLALLAGILLPSLQVARREAEPGRAAPAAKSPPQRASTPSLRAQDGIFIPSAEALMQYQNDPGKLRTTARAADESLLPAPDVDRSTAAEAPPEIRALHLETIEESATLDNQLGQVAGFTGDNCDSCIPVRPGETYIGNNANATTGAPTSCGGGEDVFDVWHCFQATCTGTAKISLCGSATSFDTTLAAYAVCRGPELTCNEDLPCGLNGRASQIEIPVVVGRPYFIRVAGFNGARGQYQLNIDLACCVNCPTGGTFENESNCGLPSDTTNGGCNTPAALAPQFSPIACGQTYCATAAYDGANRDTDWYQVEVPTPTLFTWTVSSDFTALIGLVEMNHPGSGDCADSTGVLNPFAEVASCSTGSVSVCLPPGKHWFFVAPVFANLVNCGARYTARLTCTTCVLDEACCFEDGTCRDGPRSSCLESNGTPQGPGTSCNTVVCSSVEACCFQGGGCEDEIPQICPSNGGSPQGPGTSCANTFCTGPGFGACCLGNQCTVLSSDRCAEAGGVYLGDGIPCSSGVCLGQCCLRDAACAHLDWQTCFSQFGGIYWVPRGDCDPNDCPSTGACCLSDGCIETSRDLCIEFYGGQFIDEGTDCSLDICVPLTEACCFPGGGCEPISPEICRKVGGVSRGVGTDCLGDANDDGIDDACAAPPCEECGPGEHWIHNPPCPPGGGGQDTLPSGAYAGIDTNLDCIADTNLVLGGPVTIRKKGPSDDSDQFPGLRPIDGHLDVIDTEILFMSLTGGGMTLIAGAGMGDISLPASIGAIAETPNNPAVADSFFDVFFEIRYGGASNAFNQVPLRVATRVECLPPDSLYLHITGCVPLYSSPVPGQGIHVANMVSANHFTYPGCCFGTVCRKEAPQVCEQQGGKIVPDCLADNNGNSVDDACECAPMPDGSGCQQTGCFVGIELCQPHCATFNPATGQTTVAACDCAGTSECHAEIVPQAAPTCAGGCGLNEVCEGQRTVNPDGTITLCCDCAPPTAVEVDFFPNTGALLELQLPEGGSTPIALSGPTTVHVFFEGPNEGDAADNDGNGLDEVQTQMVDMQLTGNSIFGPVVVRLHPTKPSLGLIEETANTQAGRLDLPPFAPNGTASSFFDVFFEIQVGNFRFHTQTPKRMSSVITHKPPAPGNVYENPEKIALLDENGQPTGFSIGAGRHVPRPEDRPCEDCGGFPHWVDQCPGGTDIMPTGALVGISLLGLDCNPETSAVLNGPVDIARRLAADDSLFYPGLRPIDGHLDVIDTEIVSMNLTGSGLTLRAGAGSGLGAPLRPSRGVIVEDVVNPLLAHSFFDVFFEVDLGGGRFAYNVIPMRVAADLTCVPPQVTYIHVTECIPLFDSPFPSVIEPVAHIVEPRHGTFPACGSDVTGDCFAPHDTPFCNRGECCERVCTLVPQCCSNVWNPLCAALARDICQPTQACCLPGGGCKDVTAALCELTGGLVQGAETSCESTTCPRPGDHNGDGKVDLLDFAAFQICFTGPNGTTRPECFWTDYNQDGTVDAADYVVWRRSSGGP